MAIPLIIGLGALLLGGAIAVAFWDEMKDFLSSLLSNFKSFVKNLLRGVFLGVKVYIETGNLSSVVNVIVKQFYKEDDKLMLKTTTKESELTPEELKKEFGDIFESNSLHDITDAAKEKLDLEL